jgi:hypothetical protein
VRFFNLDRLRRIGDDVDRGWPGYLLGGRVRTSTVVLILVFAALWWVYDDHQRAVESSPKTTQVPATQVVPPGFVPDPNYTWVPRTQVQEPTPTVTVTPTPTPTTSPTPPPLFPPIVLPPPFGPPVTSTPSPPPNPAPAPPALPPLPGLP